MVSELTEYNWGCACLHEELVIGVGIGLCAIVVKLSAIKPSNIWAKSCF